MSQQYERKDGDIVIYEERNKKSDKAPDWTGTVLIEGVEYRIALWHKGRNGTMLAGVAKVDDRQQSRQAPQRGGDDRGGFQRGSDRGSFGGRSDRGFSGRDREPARGFDDDSDIPFATLNSVW